jgi:hypothetical protein
MTLEQKRVLIAEACGWNDCNDVLGHWRGTNPHGMVMPLPDYFNDLNACAEMEKLLTERQWCDYLYWLRKQDQRWFAAHCATAAQRAEAFGLTMGLWTNE